MCLLVLQRPFANRRESRFYKCALQVNPFSYITRHAKQSPCKTDDEYNEAIVAAYLHERLAGEMRGFRSALLPERFKSFSVNSQFEWGGFSDPGGSTGAKALSMTCSPLS